MRESRGPDGARPDAQPREYRTHRGAHADHHQNAEPAGRGRVVVAQQNQRGVPQPPDDTAEQQGGGRAESEQVRQQPSAPAQLFAESGQQIQDAAEHDVHELQGDERTDRQGRLSARLQGKHVAKRRERDEVRRVHAERASDDERGEHERDGHREAESQMPEKPTGGAQGYQPERLSRMIRALDGEDRHERRHGRRHHHAERDRAERGMLESLTAQPQRQRDEP